MREDVLMVLMAPHIIQIERLLRIQKGEGEWYGSAHVESFETSPQMIYEAGP